MKGFTLLAKTKMSEMFMTQDQQFVLSKNYHRYNGKCKYDWTVQKKVGEEITVGKITQEYKTISPVFNDLRLAKNFIREQYLNQFAPAESN